jgi:alanine or glycine:cation symporter, AGCS family
MEKGLNKRWMGILFAILITLCFGLVFNSVQANTITVAFESTYGINRAVLGLIIAVVFAVIIFGGVKRVARITEWMVPVMAVIYILLALYVVLTNITQLPAVFKQIFAGAFGLEQAVGGGIGAAMMQGIKRGLFSNEAGMGSAPNAAATATVSHPAKQGMIQALGVFVDTLIICSCTSMIVLFSSAFTHDNLSGIEIAQLALNQQVGVWAEHFLTISIFLFAFSSLIGNYYYGETNIEFIRENKTWLLIYRLAVVAMVIWGSVTQVQVVWDLADLFMGLMAILNLIAILLLGKVAFAVLQNYHQQLKEGKNPSFTSDQIQDLTNADCWEKSGSARRTG